jgi:hypothetical protein
MGQNSPAVEGPLERLVRAPHPERTAIIARARAMRAEIQQLFDDAAHWNSVHTPWKGEPIDPDPGRQLRRIAEGIDRMLAKEGG